MTEPDQPTPVDQQEDLVSTESASRVHAFQQAAELFRDCYLEANPDDLIMVADWLLTGSADTAIRFSDQRARNFGHRPDESPDAARWTGEAA